MLLVDADHAERRERREHGRAGADDDGRLAGNDPFALVPPFGVGETRVEQRHPVAEAGAEAAERLRRQRDLRHEDDRASGAGESGLTRPDVHLGLAAPGRAGEQDVPAAGRDEALDPREHALLRLREPGRRRLGGQAGRGRHLSPVAAPLGLLRRDQGESARRRRAVVVREPEGEVDERRRERLEHALGGDGLDVWRRLGVGVDDDAAARELPNGIARTAPFSTSSPISYVNGRASERALTIG